MHSQCTAAKARESSDEFILARETVVPFVQNSILEAVDQQKRFAENIGKANVPSLNECYIVMLSLVNLP